MFVELSLISLISIFFFWSVLLYRYYSCADNFDRLKAALDSVIPILGEQARGYINQLKEDADNTRRAVESGDDREVISVLEISAKHIEDGAEHARPSPKLYLLASSGAPLTIRGVIHSIILGLLTGKAVPQLAADLAIAIKGAEALPFA